MGGNMGGMGSGNGMPNDIKNLVSTIQHATQMLQNSGYNMQGGNLDVTESPLEPHMISVNVPDPKPLASSGSAIAKRLFFVCKDCNQPPPPHIITDVFSRFGNLVEAYVMKGKNCGYAKYTSENSADQAINTLNEAVLMGAFMKVMVAEESDAMKKRKFDD